MTRVTTCVVPATESAQDLTKLFTWASTVNVKPTHQKHPTNYFLEPARFDIPSKNVSTKRGNSVVLHCHVYGDSPIDITWTKNGNKLDLNSYR